MKIETTITPRDLKLITVVGSIAIVIVCVWAGIQPLWNTHQDLTQQVAAQQQRVQQATDPSLAKDLQASANATLASLRKDTLKGYQRGTMNAAKANALATDLANTHNLHVIDVSFALPGDEAYAAAPDYAPSDGSTGTSSDGSGDTPAINMGQGAQAADTGDLTGIYQTDMQLTLSGSRTSLQNFVNDVSAKHPGIRVQQFQWTQASDDNTADRNRRSTGDWHLAVNLAVYSFGKEG